MHPSGCDNALYFVDRPTDVIREYLQENHAKSICGRFQEGQLHQKPRVSFYELAYKIVDAHFMSYAKKWLAIIALSFLFSQDGSAQAKPPVKNKDSAYSQNTPLVLGKVAPAPAPIKGKPVLTKPGKKIKKKETKKEACNKEEIIVTMGMIRRD